MSRGAGSVAGGASLALHVFRADMAPGATPAYGSTYDDAALAATLDKDSKISFTNPQYFLPNAAQKTGFIAVYPNTGTYNQSNRTITFSDLDGTHDILVSNFVEGSRNTSTLPSMTFNHMLTKVDVIVKGDGVISDVAKIYGAVTKIEIKDRKLTTVVTFQTPTEAATSTTSAADATLSTSGTAANLTLTKADGTATTNVTLTASEQAFGQAMFAPITTSSTLTLLVTTVNSGSPISVTIPAQKWEVSKANKITLTFSLTQSGGTVVTPVTTTTAGGVDPWGTGSNLSGDIK
jgi:hypothetical protein